MKPCPFCAESIQDAAIKCRYCGSDLAAAAKSRTCPFCAKSVPLAAMVCPSCGDDISGEAPQAKEVTDHAPGSSVGLAAVVLFAGLVGFALWPSGGVQDRPAGVAVATASISAASLAAAYRANEVAADRAYKGKTLEVSGTVEGVGNDLLDRAVVSLLTTDDLAPVRATGDGQFKNAAAAFAKGTPVRLRCTGGGEMLGSPLLNDCVTVD